MRRAILGKEKVGWGTGRTTNINRELHMSYIPYLRRGVYLLVRTRYAELLSEMFEQTSNAVNENDHDLYVSYPNVC